MGCTSSRVEGEGCVSKSKARERYMKQAVQHRHVFAASHSAYTQSLKNTGAALRQFGEGQLTKEDPPPHHHPNSNNITTCTSTSASSFFLSTVVGERGGMVGGGGIGGRVEGMLPPPPPPPGFTPSPLSMPPPLRTSIMSRAISMPLSFRGSRPGLSFSSPSPSARRNLKEYEEEEREEYVGSSSAPPPPPIPPLDQTSEPPSPPPPPRRTSHWDYLDLLSLHQDSPETDTPDTQQPPYKRTPEPIMEDPEKEEGVKDGSEKGEDETKRLQLILWPKNSPGLGRKLTTVLRELDDLSLRAFESGTEVSRMLEARKIHYHSNFADNADTADHHVKLLRIISWDKPPVAPGSLLGNGYTPQIPDHDEKDTHAATLDKLLAWEKKLHDDVKAGEIVRKELERRLVQLKKRKKKKADDSLNSDKSKAMVKNLQTRYLVEFQAMDAAAFEVRRLRDDFLYRQLVDLVEGLSNMWNTIHECHQHQYEIVGDMKFLDNSSAPEHTTPYHRKNTLQLEIEINLWQTNFERMITSQKDYMEALHSWLRLNAEIEGNAGSSPQQTTTPVFRLCKIWHQALEQIPSNVALQSLKGFSNIIHEMVMKQAEELKQKKKLEMLTKDLDKKTQSLIAYERKHMDELPRDYEKESGVKTPLSSALQEKQSTVEIIKKAVEEEREKYEKLCLQSRSMTLTSLQTGLPPVLTAMTSFAQSCSNIYAGLHELTVTGRLPQNFQGRKSSCLSLSDYKWMNAFAIKYGSEISWPLI